MILQAAPSAFLARSPAVQSTALQTNQRTNSATAAASRRHPQMNLPRKLHGSPTSALARPREVRGIHGGYAKGLIRSPWIRISTGLRSRRSLSRASENHECSGSSWSGTSESSSNEQDDGDSDFKESSPESSYDEQRKRWAAGVRMIGKCLEDALQQSQRRGSWRDADRFPSDIIICRSKTGRRNHKIWEPQVLDPAPLLSDIKVVMVRTKRPVTIGTVARACSSFELENICMVAPDCDPMQRAGRNASCGAQYLLHRLEYCDTVEDAVADCSCSVAFTRWLPGQKQQSVRSMAELVSALNAKGTSGMIALVFGREDTGLYDEEIAACDMVCSIPIGRLQESLSVSHAVTIPLAQIFESRLMSLGGDGAEPWLCSAGEDENKTECSMEE